MNLKQIRALSTLTTLLYQGGTPAPTGGNLKITDDSVELDINGNFRRLHIYFTGSIYIYNKLPDGFFIKMTDSVIIITNLLLKNLHNNNIVFKYDGSFEISRAHIITIGGETINLQIEDINKLELINNSKTNVEDETLLLIHEEVARDIIIVKKGIDDDSIKGLYAHKPLPDGYTGSYNYHPKENIYMTGKTLTNQSKPVGRIASSFKVGKNKLSLRKILNKTSKMSVKRGVVSDTRVITKPIKTKITPRKKEIKTTKGGKY